MADSPDVVMQRLHDEHAGALWGHCRGPAPMTTHGRFRPMRLGLRRTTRGGWATRVITDWACQSVG